MGRVDRRRWPQSPCSAQLILTCPCMTTMKVQNAVYGPRGCLRYSKISRADLER